MTPRRTASVTLNVAYQLQKNERASPNVAESAITIALPVLFRALFVGVYNLLLHSAWTADLPDLVS